MILAPFLTAFCSPSGAPDSAPTGRYVEARTASVFAGACHYGGERTTDGREALSAWSFASGSFGGVDLTGAALALLVVDDRNLADAPSARRSVVYVSSSETAARRTALVGWLASTCAEVTGEVRAIRAVDLKLRIDADSFALSGSDVFELAGDALPDRACCKMPYQVWYAPLVALEGQLVGRDAQFSVTEPALACTWSRPGENAAFFGAFGTRDGSSMR